MVIFRKELAETGFTGTVIDLESVGDFNDYYFSSDPRRYAFHRATVFGYLTDGGLVQYCAEGMNELPVLVDIINDVLPSLDSPFYALNCHFERGVFVNTCSLVPKPLIDVRGRNLRGSKWAIRGRLGIPKYDDPFDGDGRKCKEEWKKGNYPDCLKHNRACLLIERDILLHNRSTL